MAIKSYVIVVLVCLFSLLSCNPSNSSEENKSYQNSQQNLKIEKPTKETKEEITQPSQYKKHSITERIAGKTYTYTFVVSDGNLSWSYKGPDVKKTVTKRYKCNPDISANAIIAECNGIAYWNLTSAALYEMTDEIKYYSYDLHKKAKQMLSKCVSSLSDSKKNCPGAFKKAQSHYTNLIDAEGQGADALWEEICLLAYGLEEYPLEVCDIYFDD